MSWRGSARLSPEIVAHVARNSSSPSPNLSLSNNPAFARERHSVCDISRCLLSGPLPRLRAANAFVQMVLLCYPPFRFEPQITPIDKQIGVPPANQLNYQTRTYAAGAGTHDKVAKFHGKKGSDVCYPELRQFRVTAAS